MDRAHQGVPIGRLALSLLLCAGLSLRTSGAAHAQDENQASDGGYHYGESQTAPPLENNSASGPVRLARFSVVRGSVTWRGDDQAEWSQASVNLPLRQGAQIWVSEGGRAEIQFDDGSLLRLGNNALVTLQTLYSDQDGEFTEMKLNDGLISLRLKHEHSIYQIDTPLVSVKTSGPSKLRIGAGDGVEVAVKSGRATIEGGQGKATLESGDYLDLRDSESAYDPHGLPRSDSWDQWNDDRDRALDDASQSNSCHLPSNISIVTQELDDYGTWRNDPTYGEVWCPRVQSATWRPYSAGRWVWVNPFGWTWVSEEPWGWAPYHYGTWVRGGYGWGWVPGPVNQYWSPAVVHFSEYDGQVAWVPLAPREVVYPSRLSIGFRSGNWSLFYSIGQCAVYYPTYNNVCEARPWNTRYVNRVTSVTNVYNNTTVINNVTRSGGDGYVFNRNTYLRNARFTPINSRGVSGVTVASASAFGGQGAYRALPSGATDIFTRGRAIAAPALGSAPVAGPIAVRPTFASLTPSRSFARAVTPAPTSLSRPVFRAPVARSIERASAPVLPSGSAAAQLNARPSLSIGQTGRVPGGFATPGRSAAITPTPDALNRRNGLRDRALQAQNGTTQPGMPELGRGVRPSVSPRARDITPELDRLSQPTTRPQPVRANSAQESAIRARQSLGLPTRTSSGSPGRSDRTPSVAPGLNDRAPSIAPGRANHPLDGGGSRASQESAPGYGSRARSGYNYNNRTRDEGGISPVRPSDNGGAYRAAPRRDDTTARPADASRPRDTYRQPELGRDRGAAPQRSAEPTRQPSYRSETGYRVEPPVRSETSPVVRERSPEPTHRSEAPRRESPAPEKTKTTDSDKSKDADPGSRSRPSRRP